MRFSFYPYELNPRVNLGPVGGANGRKGALLKVFFESLGTGYADCHPWPELGDQPLATQLDCLKSMQLSQLLKASLQFAHKDAEARKLGLYLFDGLTVPRSHFLCPDLQALHEILPSGSDHLTGFRSIKIKSNPGELLNRAGFSILQDCLKELQKRDMRLRIDFNFSLRQNDVLPLVDSLGALANGVGFFEDPFAWDPLLWEQISRQSRVPLALDRGGEEAVSPTAAQVRVLKPAIHPWVFEQKPQGRKFVVTSYLDHPLGQVQAAWMATQLSQREPSLCLDAGVASHRVYETNAFSERLGLEKGVLIPPANGLGFGFDDLLESLPWRPL